MRRLFLLISLALLGGCDDSILGSQVGFSADIPFASRLAFTVQPSNTGLNLPITPAVQVVVLDGSGAIVTTSNATITISIAAGTGTPGAILLGATQVFAVNGVATFANLRVDRVGGGYTLIATSPDLTTTGSAAFDIVP